MAFIIILHSFQNMCIFWIWQSLLLWSLILLQRFPHVSFSCMGLCLSYLNHWGRVTHICVGNLTIIGSDNGLSPGRRQAITWTNAGLLLIGRLGTNFNEILLGIQTFSFKKMHLKMSSAKKAAILSRPQWVNDGIHAQEIGLLWHFGQHCIHHHNCEWNLFRLLLLNPCHGIGAKLWHIIVCYICYHWWHIFVKWRLSLIDSQIMALGWGK